MTTWTATRHGAVCRKCKTAILPGQSCVWDRDRGGQLHESCGQRGEQR